MSAVAISRADSLSRYEFSGLNGSNDTLNKLLGSSLAEIGCSLRRLDSLGSIEDLLEVRARLLVYSLTWPLVPVSAQRTPSQPWLPYLLRGNNCCH
jgi:hypothetical protein